MNSALLHSAPLAALLLAVCAPRALSQGGGFAPGELILYRHDSPNGQLLRIDPLTGQTALLASVPYTVLSGGQAAYDPFRDRVVVCTALQYNQPLSTYVVDGAGQFALLGVNAGTYHAFAPTGDGRIYFVCGASYRYADAANVEHVLMDASGAQPFLLATDYAGPRVMLYDAGTNALFGAYETQYTTCPGGAAASISVYKLPLSAGGERVVGPVGCVQHAVSPGGFTRPVGISRGPAGQLLVVVDSNTNNAEPRLVLVDPATLATMDFAIHGPYVGAAAVMSGTWSSVRGQAVMLDYPSGGVVMRAFSQGDSGGGTVIASPMPFAFALSALFEVPPGDCGVNNVSLYCTAKTTSSGCVPQISTVGGPMLSATNGFTISVAQVEPQQNGIFFYGRSGALAAPFQGGVMCVHPPIVRTPIQSSGGAAACSGRYSFDFLAWLAAGNDPLVAAGTQIDGQFWFRDPAAASTTGLSAGVEWTMCP